MEEPFRRTAIGFDTNDHTLDVVVSSDLKWSWKDEQSMSERVSAGQYSNEFAAAVRAEAEQVVKSIELRLSPFCDGWEKWVPDSTWGIPQLPLNWDSAPIAAWDRRAWAYPGCKEASAPSLE